MRNGLYSVHVDLMDGRVGKGSGVVVFRDGQIRGGDAYLFYVGTYQVTGAGIFRGELSLEQHTPSPQANPLFGGQRDAVGIGVTGTFKDDRATMNGTALVGKESLLFKATLHWLTEAD